MKDNIEFIAKFLEKAIQEIKDIIHNPYFPH
jgi:hypothetical protein